LGVVVYYTCTLIEYGEGVVFHEVIFICILTIGWMDVEFSLDIVCLLSCLLQRAFLGMCIFLIKKTSERKKKREETRKDFN